MSDDGHVHDLHTILGTEAGRRDPYPIYQLLREYPPAYDERHHAYLVTTYHDCSTALTSRAFGRPDKEFIARRIPRWREHPGLVTLSHAMQFGDPATHTRLRGAVKAFFTPRRVHSLIENEAHSVDSLVDALAEELTAHGEADLQEVLSFRLPSISIAGLLGIPEADIRPFRQHALILGRILEPGQTPEQLSALDEACITLGAYFVDVIAARRASPRDDLATHLVRCHDEGILSSDELTAMFLSIYGAGTINTSNFIGNGVAALVASPREAALLSADPSLAEAAVTEILRYDTPMQVTRRIAVTDTVLGGTHIPAGVEIAVALGAANRDPAVFPDPDVFRIRRGTPGPLSFGGGAFYCIGAALGKLEGTLIFRKLSARLPTLRISEPTVHNLRSVLRGYLRIPVTTGPQQA